MLTKHGFTTTLVTLGVAAGCNSISGFNDLSFEGSGGATSTSSTSTSGIGGTGGAGASASGSGGAGGSGGAAGHGGSGGSSSGCTVAGTAGPSCDNLPATCGASESCCASCSVPSGTYNRSYDGIDHTDHGYPATVSAFALDRFEVTVGRFRLMVVAGRGVQGGLPSPGDGAHPKIAQSGWNTDWDSELELNTNMLKTALECDPTYQTWTDPAGSNETLPINCVTWYEAFAFCAWDGGWLPTEAEWNHAAAGGSEHRYYPWSDPYPPGSTTLDDTYAVYGCLGDGTEGCAFTDILSSGSRSPKGDGRWGQADLGGSMSEWTRDWGSGYQNPCNDCVNPVGPSSRVLRGGGWSPLAIDLRASYRNNAGPNSRSGYYGFRCARAQ